MEHSHDFIVMKRFCLEGRKIMIFWHILRIKLYLSTRSKQLKVSKISLFCVVKRISK